MQNSVIEQIKSRLPITEILSTYLTLLPSGTQFKAKCPFHNERTASFSVSPERGAYYCFGCGAKGDIFTFIEQFEGVDFKGALKILADRAGIVLSAKDTPTESIDPLYDALESATLRYEGELKKNTNAIEYLKARGFTDETITSFRLGYAPEEWRYIASGCKESELAAYERAGMIKKTEKGYYDRFRGRIMFPMADSSGRIVAFSGRMFPDTPEGPKYLNSPETEVFQKSRILYGFDKAKLPIKKHNFAILVEGQVDMVLSHQAGFRNTVATSGTAVSDMSVGDPGAQLSVLARLTPNLFLAFDGDNAGEKALSRAAVVALALGLNPKVVPLPQGVDPADYIAKNGADAWKELLKESSHFIIHKLRVIQKESTSPHQLVRAVREQLFPFLIRVSSPIEQKLYLDSVAKESGLGIEEVSKEFAMFQKAQPIAPVLPTDTSASQPGTKALALSNRFLALVELYPTEGIQKAKAMLDTLVFDGIEFVFPEISAEEKLEATTIVERDYGYLDSATRESLAEELAEKIANQFYVTLRAGYTTELYQAEAKGDEEKAQTLMIKLKQLNERRHSP